MASNRDVELLGELEDEMQEYEEEGPLHEEELESEQFFGAIGSALSGLLGEGEEEAGFLESELEEEMPESEWEEESHEGEWEEESGELFFGRLIKRAMPSLRGLVKFGLPKLAGAFAGPLGGQIASLVTRNLEGEYEDEMGELEVHEGEYEAHAEAHTESEAHAELMAAAAAEAATEAEAEALIGAATWGTLSPRERRELRRVSAHLVRANHILLRVLRRRRSTAPFVRTLPYITKMTARTLVRQRARTGRPITRGQAARAMTTHTRRVLGRPQLCSLALRRNVVASRRLQRSARIPVRATVVSTSARPRRVRY